MPLGRPRIRWSYALMHVKETGGEDYKLYGSDLESFQRRDFVLTALNLVFYC
jgi:hypothetical protein